MSRLKGEGQFPLLNTYGWFIIVINLAFFIVNTFSLCINFPRAKNFGFDYLGVIVGILAILVTVLIGWQIFINLSFEKKVDKRLMEITDELKTEIDNRISMVSKESEDKRRASIVMSLYQNSCSAYMLKKYDFALWLLLDCISHYNLIKNKDSVLENDEYKNIIETLNLCILLVPKIDFLSQDQIDKYLKVAKELQLIDVAHHLKYKSVSNSNNSNNYIKNIITDKLPENQNINIVEEGSIGNFIS